MDTESQGKSQQQPALSSEAYQDINQTKQQQGIQMQIEEHYQKQQKNEDDIRIDLNIKPFSTIIQLCLQQGLIGEDLEHSYSNNHILKDDIDYINLYKLGKLSQYNFQKCKINIIDHRRLTDLLVSHNPRKYIAPSNPNHLIPQVRQFLKYMYSTSSESYYSLLNQQVNTYYQSWFNGPVKIQSVVDPPLKFYETQHGQKLRIQRENAIRIQTIQQQKQRNKRLNTQRANRQDLQQLAKKLLNSVYGPKAVKMEEEEKSSNDNKIKKQKKQKKQKKDKKKKEKKDKKAKHSGKKDDVKQQNEDRQSTSKKKKSKSKSKQKE